MILNQEVDKKRAIAVLVPAFLFIVSCLVILGWIIDNSYLTSLGKPGIMVSMKFGIALCFLGTALAMLDRRYNWIMFSAILYQLSAFPVFWLTGYNINVHFGNDVMINTIVPGLPSLGAVLCLILSIFYVIHDCSHGKQGLKLVVGIVVLGYILNVDYMKFYINGISTAMALHTAILFGFIAIWKRID